MMLLNKTSSCVRIHCKVCLVRHQEIHLKTAFPNYRIPAESENLSVLLKSILSLCFAQRKKNKTKQKLSFLFPTYCHCTNGSYYIRITDLHIRKRSLIKYGEGVNFQMWFICLIWYSKIFSWPKPLFYFLISLFSIKEELRGGSRGELRKLAVQLIC